MKIPGERIRKTKWVYTDRFVVSVEVEYVVPPDEPGEPCLEAETIGYLEDIRRHAEAGDRTWLRQQGKVYEVVTS